jgi:uncharacterized protein (TIGR02118 family)
MVKLVAFFKRKPGMSPEDFQHHWHTRHAALVVKQAGMRRYVQNHVLLSSYRRGEPAFDGVAEAWFDDTDAMRALAPSPAYAAVRADEANFIDAASMGVVLCDEVVIADGAVPPGAVKWISFIKKRADLSVDAFQDYWRTRHAQLVARLPGVVRYVQCHARRGIYATGRTPPFDGIAMVWFESRDALRESGKGPAFEAIRADEGNLIAPGGFPAVAAAEREIAV